MNFKMDLSKFKKVGSSKTHTELEHEDGHRLKINHSKLHPKVRKELEKLAVHEDQGGSIPKPKDDIPEPDPKKAREFQKGATSSGFNPDQWKKNLKEGLGLAHGGKAPVRMADGGMVADIGKENYSESESHPTRRPYKKDEQKQEDKIQHFADGGEAKPEESTPAQAPVVINVGGSGAQQPQSPPAENPIMSAISKGADMASHGLGSAWDAIKSAGAQALGIPEAKADTSPQSAPMPVPAIAPPRQPEAPAMQAAPQAMPQPAAASAPMASKPSQPGGFTPEQQMMGIFPKGMPNVEEAYKTGLQANQAQYVADQAAIQAQSEALKAKAAAQQDFADTFKKNQDEVQKQRDDLRSIYLDPKSDIHPDTFANKMYGNKDTLGKVKSFIGFILAGAGAGMLHQENPIVKMINQEIDRDVDAQKANLGKTENLLKMNQQDFGNIHDAATITKANLADHVATLMDQAANSTKDLQAKARILQGKQELLDKYAAPMQELALTRSLFSGGPNGAPRMQDPALYISHNPLIPKERKAEGFKELEEASNLKRKGDEIVNAWQQGFDLQRGYSALHPVDTFQKNKQVEALIQPLIAGLSKDTAGRFTEQDAKMLETLAPSMTDDEKTFKIKLARVKQMVQGKLSDNNFPVLRSGGVNLNKFDQFKDRTPSAAAPVSSSGANAQYVAWAKANPTNPIAVQYLKKYGIQ